MLALLAVIFTLLLHETSSFHAPSRCVGAKGVTALCMRHVDVTTRNLHLTPALQDRVDAKVGKVLDKVGRNAISAQVKLQVIKYPANEHHTNMVKPHCHIAEASVHFKGVTLRAREEADEMFASIDLLSHKLARNIVKHKQRQRGLARKAWQQQHTTSLKDEVVPAAEDDEESYWKQLDEQYREDFRPLEVVREKSFPMPPISVEEAVSALDIYLDHPFYMFRNEDTNEINVVYRRKEGGVGLIEPTAAAPDAVLPNAFSSKQHAQ